MSNPKPFVKVEAIDIDTHAQYAADQFVESIAHLNAPQRLEALKELNYQIKINAQALELSHE